MPDTVTVDDSAETIASQITHNYLWNLVAMTILYYDYALTLGEEVRSFWGKRPTAPSVLFFSNRYISILGTAPLLLQVFGQWSAEGCDNLQKYHQFLSIAVQIVVGVIMILRTYALYELNRKLLIFLSFFAFLVICVGITSVVGDFPIVVLPYDVSSFSGCHTLIPLESGIRLAGAWGSLLLFDTCIIALTLRKAMIIKRFQNRGLFHVLIRDGTIYYIVFSVLNLAQIILFVIGTPQLRGLLTTFANVISSTLISRLMLNLKNPRLFEPSRIGGTTYSTLGAFVAASHGEVGSGSGAGTTHSIDATLYSPGIGGTESWKSQMYSDEQAIELTSLDRRSSRTHVS